jgi:hypothetical protein
VVLAAWADGGRAILGDSVEGLNRRGARSLVARFARVARIYVCTIA